MTATEVRCICSDDKYGSAAAAKRLERFGDGGTQAVPKTETFLWQTVDSFGKLQRGG